MIDMAPMHLVYYYSSSTPAMHIQENRIQRDALIGWRKSLPVNIMQKRKKKQFYGRSKKKQRTAHGEVVSVGATGLLVTVETGRIGNAVRELRNMVESLLEDATPETETTPKTTGVSCTLDDLEAELAAELENSDENASSRVKLYDTQAKGCIFAEVCAKATPSLTPATAAQKLVSLCRQENVFAPRFCHRVYPVDVVCKAHFEDVVKACRKVIEEQFNPLYGTQPVRYRVLFRSRMNDSVKVTPLLNSICTFVNPWHIADLRNPECVLFVNVVKHLCYVGIGANYRDMFEYNLKGPEDTTTANTTGAKTDATSTTSQKVHVTNSNTDSTAVAQQQTNEESAASSDGQSPR